MSDWFDSIARRTATRAGAARGTSQDDIAEHSAAGATGLLAPEQLSFAIEPVSRRTSLKWTLGTALGLTAGPALLAAAPDVAQAYFNPAGLTDDTILALADNAIDAKPLGQAFKSFGLEDGPFAYVDAAITFYVAAEVLGGDQPSPGGQPPPGEPPPSGVQCEPDQIYCGCNGGFCLIAGDCSSYC